MPAARASPCKVPAVELHRSRSDAPPVEFSVHHGRDDADAAAPRRLEEGRDAREDVGGEEQQRGAGALEVDVHARDGAADEAGVRACQGQPGDDGQDCRGRGKGRCWRRWQPWALTARPLPAAPATTIV